VNRGRVLGLAYKYVAGRLELLDAAHGGALTHWEELWAGTPGLGRAGWAPVNDRKQHAPLSPLAGRANRRQACKDAPFLLQPLRLVPDCNVQDLPQGSDS
jgi:hypothetical protein